MNRLEAEQPLVYSTIMNMVERRQLPHALLFYGDKSTCKKGMAIYLAEYLYAKFYNTTVDESPVTHRIEDGSFTNVFFIEPNGTTIRKEQISSIIDEASKSSLEDGPKIFIFNNADSLNQSSANSLLKFIEEPLDEIYIIFLVDNLNTILSTIKSRCSLLSFRPLNREFLKERLDLLGIEDYVSNVLMEYTQNEEEIVTISKDEGMMKVFDLIPSIFNEPFENGGSMVLYFKEYADLLDNDDKGDFFLSLYIYYLEDILNNCAFGREDFIFKNEKARIKVLSNLTTKEVVSDLIKETMEIKTRIKYHINFRLNIDSLLLDTEISMGKKV